MDQKIEFSKLNTKNLCFLCLKPTQLKIIKKKVTIVSGDESKIKPPVSLTRILCHLSIQLEPEIKADLCSDCEWVVTKLSDLFQQYQNLQPDLKNKSLLGKVQMELNYYLEKMLFRISNGGKNHKLFHRYTTEMAKDSESTSQLEWIDNLRKEISDKCSKIRFNPTVEIMELLRLEMEIRNKPVPKDEKVASVEKEMSRGTLKTTSGQTEDQSSQKDLGNRSKINQKWNSSTCRFYCKTFKKSFRHRCPTHNPVHLQQRWKCHLRKHCVFNVVKKKPQRYFKFQCSTCGKRFPVMWWLRLHEKADHPSKKFKTSSDPLEISKSGLPNNISKKITAAGADEESDSSGKADKNANQTNKIFNTATNQKFYRDLSTGLLCCSICHKSFSFPFAVYKHQNSCHQSIQKDLEKEKLKNYCKLHCLTCDKRFAAMWDLFRHQKVFHTDSRSFKCDICNKTFETVGKVTLHKHVVQRNKEKDEPSSHFTGASAQAEKSTQTEPFNLASIANSNCHSSQAQTQTDPQSQLTVESANNWIINPVTNQLTPMKVYPEVYLFSSSNSLTNTCPIQAFPVQLYSSTISLNNPPDLSNYFIQQATQSLDNETVPSTVDSSNENSYVLSISEF